MYTQEDLEFIEFMFHYGDMHFVETVSDMTLRKIKAILRINQKRIDDEELGKT